MQLNNTDKLLNCLGKFVSQKSLSINTDSFHFRTKNIVLCHLKRNRKKSFVGCISSVQFNTVQIRTAIMHIRTQSMDQRSSINYSSPDFNKVLNAISHKKRLENYIPLFELFLYFFPRFIET